MKAVGGTVFKRRLSALNPPSWYIISPLFTLEESLGRHGAPEIFNTDQGSQFTSDAFTGLLKASEIQISMDGKGSWKDNVFVERLWKSVKYEEVYLRAY